MKNLRDAVAFLLQDVDDNQIVIGPVVPHPHFLLPYFIVAAHGPDGFWYEKLMIERPAYRSAMIAALALEKPLVIHVMDDDHDLARLCNELWPGEQTARILASLNQERVLN